MVHFHLLYGPYNQSKKLLMYHELFKLVSFTFFHKKIFQNFPQKMNHMIYHHQNHPKNWCIIPAQKYLICTCHNVSELLYFRCRFLSTVCMLWFWHIICTYFGHIDRHEIHTWKARHYIWSIISIRSNGISVDVTIHAGFVIIWWTIVIPYFCKFLQIFLNDHSWMRIRCVNLAHSHKLLHSQ